MDASEIVARLELNLMSLGIYVERHARESGTLHVEYETADAGLTQADLGHVSTELRDAQDDGWEPEDCQFWVFDTEGGFHGKWLVRGGWLRALDRGNLTETDFSTLVLSAREPAEEPPAPVPGVGGAQTES